MGKPSEALALLDRVRPLTKTAAEFLDIGNRANVELGKIERAAIPRVLVAGAAFHLAKAEVRRGDWEHMIRSASPFALRTVRQRMETVDSALLKLGFGLDRRAYETIVFSSKYSKRHNCAVLKTPFAKELIGAIERVLGEKSANQIELELFIRKPKQVRAGSDATEEQNRKTDRDLALGYMTDVCEGINALGRLGKHLDDEHLNRLAWACFDGLRRAVPEWPLQILPPMNKPAIELEQFLVSHLGRRPE